ncbi:MAG: metallophosphoesterase [Actinomycetota bacterium]|nr:metallophosphoesterase [Actinomycetota bacterium]
MQPDLSEELIGDLLRSAWVIESARSNVYAGWAESEDLFAQDSRRAAERAGIVERSLAGTGREPDRALVQPHADWIRSLAGSDPAEVTFGDLFVARLGSWVEGHASGFLGDGAAELHALGEEERSVLRFPTSLPEPPGFEPLATPEIEAPGDVRFRFGILADLHIGSPTGEATARAAIADLNREGVDLVIQLGDITDQGDSAEFKLAMKVLDGLEMPVTTMMGNHDVYSRGEQRISGREYYLSSFGREADGVLLEHQGMRFAVLDSVEHAATPFAPYDLVKGAFVEGPGGAIVRGALTAPQHELLAEVAAPGAPPAFVFLHHPPQPFTSFPPIIFGLRDADSGRLHATVDSGNVWGVFAGHTHRNARTRDFDGVPAHEVAIPRDYPFGYGIVDVTSSGYAYRFKQLSDEDLLREGYGKAGTIHRRYGRGSEAERAFVWTAPGSPS